MAKLFELDENATASFDDWQKLNGKANEAGKAARRHKTDFERAFGDRDKALLSDGRVVQRVREERAAYDVKECIVTRFIIVPA